MYICQNTELFQFQHFNYTKNTPQKMHQQLYEDDKLPKVKCTQIRLCLYYVRSYPRFIFLNYLVFIYTPGFKWCSFKRMKKFPRFLFWNSSSSLSGLNTWLKKRFCIATDPDDFVEKLCEVAIFWVTSE